MPAPDLRVANDFSILSDAHHLGSVHLSRPDARPQFPPLALDVA